MRTLSGIGNGCLAAYWPRPGYNPVARYLEVTQKPFERSCPFKCVVEPITIAAAAAEPLGANSSSSSSSNAMPLSAEIQTALQAHDAEATQEEA